MKTQKGLLSQQEAVQRALPTLYNVQLVAPANATIAQHQFTKSLSLSLASGVQKSGQILSVIGKTFSATSTLKPNAMDLVFFNANPSIAVAQVGLSTTNARRTVGIIQILVGDWIASFATSAISHTTAVMPFTTTPAGTLFLAGVNRSATAFNNAPADNDELLVSFHFEMRAR